MKAPAHTAALVVFLTLLASTSACQPEADPAPVDADRPLAVRVASVRTMSLRQVLGYVGTVRYRHELGVRAQVAGSLVELPHAPGDAVEAGEVVARMVAGDVSARTRRVRYELERAEAESTYACDKYAVDRRLVDGGVLTQSALDASRKACAASRAGHKAANAQLAELRAVHARTVERAPQKATVLEWLAEPGENLVPGQPLVALGVGDLELEVKMPEEDLRNGVTLETSVELLLAGTWHTTRIRHIAPVATGPGRTVDVRIALPDAIEVRAGAAVDARFVLASSEEARAVPNEALVRGEDGQVLFVVEDGHARRVPVRTKLSEGGRTEVLTPLTEGARVVVSNLDQLGNGVRVFAVEVPE
jgi:RND family efflux transporter MFP subunit